MPQRGKRGKAGEKANPLPVPAVVAERIDGRHNKPLVLYTPELGERICDLIAAGVTMTKLCTLDGMPARMTLWRWLSGRVEGVPEDFREKFNNANQLRLAFMASEILDIADDGTNDTYVDDKGNAKIDHDHISRSRLRVEIRQWLLAAMMPEKFAKRAHFEHKHEMRRITELSEQELDALMIDIEAEQPDVKESAGAPTVAQAAAPVVRRAEGGKGKAVH